jgi:predicted  nucleic acid-binding Zn-ribbon protein
MTLTDDLIALYRVDSQWRGLRSRVDSARDRLRIRERKLGEVRSQHEEAESRRRQAQAHMANLEGEATDYGARIEKLRTELNASTTDKQYQAILTEMKSLQSLRDEVETSQLAEMERIEAMSREVEEIAEQVADRERLVEVARTECAECETAVAERLGELERDRSEAAARIPDKVMTIFDEVAEQNEGETLAAVVEVSKRHREYSCGACHVQMPYYLVVNLHDSSTGVQQCPNCNRILHLETAETEAS